VETLLLQGDVHGAMGKREQAIADCDAAIRIAREGRDVVYRRKGHLLLSLGREKEALEAFDAALGLNPTDADTWCDAALAWRAEGQPSRAERMLDEALRLDPGHRRALHLRADQSMFGPM
ncbi:MAG TPA: tetratricopeptide repeat protein, partial [Thermoplasmata archaeon]|nr:tetratricopeptide repeat protein [Thermoplasmata archaeon]